MKCTLVTPERTIYDQPAEFVVATLFDGEVGIAPGHAPMIGRLGCGEMRIQKEKGTGPIGAKHPSGRSGQLDLSPFPEVEADRYYVEGGFIEVLGDVVTILTQRAVPAAEIDTAVAMEQLQSAQSRRAVTAEAVAARDLTVAQARARLRVARRAQSA